MIATEVKSIAENTLTHKNEEHGASHEIKDTLLDKIQSDILLQLFQQTLTESLKTDCDDYVEQLLEEENKTGCLETLRETVNEELEANTTAVTTLIIEEVTAEESNSLASECLKEVAQEELAAYDESMQLYSNELVDNLIQKELVPLVV